MSLTKQFLIGSSENNTIIFRREWLEDDDHCFLPNKKQLSRALRAKTPKIGTDWRKVSVHVQYEFGKTTSK